MSKRARRSHATYPFVGVNAHGPNFADRELEAFCGVDVPAGHGLVLLDADGAQVAFRSLSAAAASRCPAHAATLRKIKDVSLQDVVGSKAREMLSRDSMRSWIGRFRRPTCAHR